MSTLKASENLRQIGEWGVFRAERRRWAKAGADRAWYRVGVAAGSDVWWG